MPFQPTVTQIKADISRQKFPATVTDLQENWPPVAMHSVPPKLSHSHGHLTQRLSVELLFTLSLLFVVIIWDQDQVVYVFAVREYTVEMIRVLLVRQGTNYILSILGIMFR